jgi:hypothetical protein
MDLEKQCGTVDRLEEGDLGLLRSKHPVRHMQQLH